MDLSFSNVTFLGYQHSPVFLDAGIRYKLSKTFTITGLLLDLSAGSGVAATWTPAELTHALSGDNKNIVLNGISFGIGKILNISFEPGTHVQQQKFVYTIQCVSQGDLSNASSGALQGIDWTRSQYLESLDETFSYTKSESRDQTFEHRCNIRFSRDVTNLSLSPLDFAKALAASLFAASNLISFLGNYSLSAFKKTHTESYNSIDFSASLGEKTTIPFANQGTYSSSYTVSFQTSDKGITDVTDKLVIRGLTAPTNASAWQGMVAQSSESLAYARCLDAYNNYGISTLPLHDIVLQKSVLDNKFEGTIEQSCRFTNDPFIFNYAKWSRNVTFSRSVEGYITVSESGRSGLSPYTAADDA